MGKLSALPTETTFGLSDLMVKVKSAGGGDVIVALQDFLNAIGGKNYAPYKFRAYHNTTQSLATSAIVGFNTKDFDTSTNYDGINKFTAPVAGFYQFNAAVYFQSTGSVSQCQISLTKNGGALDVAGEMAIGATGDAQKMYSNLVQLALGDTVQVIVTFSGGGSKTIYGQAALPRYTYFSGFLYSLT